MSDTALNSEAEQLAINNIEQGDLSQTGHALLTNSISGQFIKISLPIIFALIINGLYNFIDAVFITRGVGINAMASVSSVFPINMFIISVSAMLGNGMAAIISRHLGSGDKQSANKVFATTLLFAISVGLIISLLLYFVRYDIYQLLALPQMLLKDADAYLVPILFITTISFTSGILTESFRAAGNPQDMMKVMLLGSLLNIVLDALFIFVFEWGVAGAAWATSLAILCSFMFAVYLQISGNDRLQLLRHELRFNMRIHKQVLSLGLPIFLSHSGFAFTLAITIFAVTKYSGADASLLISAHGLLIRCFTLLFLPLLGMSIALQTLAAFNFGAGHLKRVKQSLFTAILIGTIWTTSVTLLLVFKPQWLLQLFTNETVMIETASGISSIVFMGFITAAAGIMCSTIFQSMGKALPAMLLELTRTYLILLPLILMLPMWQGIQGVWWAFPVTDVIAVVSALLFTRYYFGNRLSLAK